MKKQLSKCCEAEIKTDCGDEGTCCYMCQKCGRACDVLVEKAIWEELGDIKDKFFNDIDKVFIKKELKLPRSPKDGKSINGSRNKKELDKNIDDLVKIADDIKNEKTIWDEFDEEFPTFQHFYGEATKKQQEMADSLEGKFTRDTKELPIEIKQFFQSRIQKIIDEIERGISDDVLEDLYEGSLLELRSGGGNIEEFVGLSRSHNELVGKNKSRKEAIEIIKKYAN